MHLHAPTHPMAEFHGLSGFPLKQLIVWGDHYKVDQPQIDAQHQGIFDIALEIVEIWHDHRDLGELKAVAERLEKVLEAHFRYEERQLEAIGYTKLDEHRSEHRMMLGQLQSIRHRLELIEPGALHSEPGFLLLSYIFGVTVGHIAHSDMDYRAFARQAADDEMVWPAS